MGKAVSVMALFPNPSSICQWARSSRNRQRITIFALTAIILIFLSNACGDAAQSKKKVTMSHPVNQSEALTIASHAIYTLMPDANFIILTEHTVERDFGWVFFYAPRRYLETQDPRDMILGAGPVIVLRQDGSTHFLPTSVSPPVAIEAFDKEWKKAHPQ